MTSIQLATAAVLTASAAAGGLAYAALWPQSQIFGRVLVAGSNPNEIALTYDDGPNDDATERLLEVLARHEVHATFFLIGELCAAAAGAGASHRRQPDTSSAITP